MRVIATVKESIADISSVKPFVRASDEGLTLEMSAIVFFAVAITPINTQLMHQLVFRRTDAVTWTDE